MSKRIKIPAQLKYSILYEAGFACVVCQKKVAHIHHTDKDSSNNVEDNLVTLCQDHHDEAHTIRELSQNLSVDKLKNFKTKWLEEVAQKRRYAANLASQRNATDSWLSSGMVWGYINHNRVSKMISPQVLQKCDAGLLEECIASGMVNDRGLINTPKKHKLLQAI